MMLSRLLLVCALSFSVPFALACSSKTVQGVNSSGSQVREGRVGLRGTVSYREKMILPADSRLVVSLYAAPEETLASYEASPVRTSPIPFELTWDEGAKIPEGFRPEIEARILSGKRLLLLGTVSLAGIESLPEEPLEIVAKPQPGLR